MAKTYKAHIWVHLGYDMEIEAESREEAEQIMLNVYDNLEWDEMEYGDGDYEIIEEV